MKSEQLVEFWARDLTVMTLGQGKTPDSHGGWDGEFQTEEPGEQGGSLE